MRFILDNDDEHLTLERIKSTLNRTSDTPKIIVEGDFQYLEMVNNGLFEAKDIINGSNIRK